MALTTNVTHFNKRNAYKLNLKLIINALKSSYCMHSNVHGDVWKWKPHTTNEIPGLNLVVESHGECSNHMFKL